MSTKCFVFFSPKAQAAPTQDATINNESHHHYPKWPLTRSLHDTLFDGLDKM